MSRWRRSSTSSSTTLVVAFSLPIAVIVTPVGGFLFGLWLGALLSVVGATLGSVAVFLAARTAFYDLFHARAGAALARLEEGFRRDSFSYLLFLRLVPVFPFWLVNIVPALARHDARSLYAGDLDRHHSRRGRLFERRLGPRHAARPRAGAQPGESSSNGASCCRCWALRCWRWCPCSTRICARARRRREMADTLTPDVCVVGGGSAGLVAAAGAAQLGLDVVLIERGLMGGDCLNYGCVPSKALIAAAKAAQAQRSGAAFGIAPVEPRIDFATVMDHVTRVIAAIAPNDSVERFEGARRPRAEGRGTLRRPHRTVGRPASHQEPPHRAGDRIAADRAAHSGPDRRALSHQRDRLRQPRPARRI